MPEPRCDVCGESPASLSVGAGDEHSPFLRLCSSCFAAQFESSVRRTIAWWSMLEAGDRIVAGVSGIDSVALVACLIALGYSDDLTCCIVQEGAGAHREKEIQAWQVISQSWGLRLVVRGFQDAYGESLQEIVASRPEAFGSGFTPCLVCALLRNRLLYRTAVEENASVLTVGGHEDDAACNQLGAILFGETITAGPILYKRAFPARQQIGDLTLSRPLALQPKSHVATYAHLVADIALPTYACEHVELRGSPRMQRVVDLLDELFPGTRRILAGRALQSAPESLPACGQCNAFRDETGSGQCAACSLVAYLSLEAA